MRDGPWRGPWARVGFSRSRSLCSWPSRTRAPARLEAGGRTARHLRAHLLEQILRRLAQHPPAQHVGKCGLGVGLERVVHDGAARVGLDSPLPSIVVEVLPQHVVEHDAPAMHLLDLEHDVHAPMEHEQARVRRLVDPQMSVGRAFAPARAHRSHEVGNVIVVGEDVPGHGGGHGGQKLSLHPACARGGIDLDSHIAGRRERGDEQERQNPERAGTGSARPQPAESGIHGAEPG